jgi:transposase-like protein
MQELVNIRNLIDDEKCYEVVRSIRWPNGVVCPNCYSLDIAKRGKDDKQPSQQRYLCKGCKKQFDDLTNTIFSKRHQSLKVWILCLYLMGLNLSNLQIAKELGLHKDDVYDMVTQLRKGIVDNKQEILLEGEIELDEVYVVAGHKGNPESVKKKIDWVEEIVLKVLAEEGHERKKNPPSLA